MNRLDYWSSETNPETGYKYEALLRYFRVAHDGYADIDKLIDSEYGEAMAKRLIPGFLYEEDPMGEACLAYYDSLGLKRELWENQSYYTRYVVISPKKIHEPGYDGRKLPIIFVHHGGGNYIEYDEFLPGFHLVAAKNDVILVYFQNTNWDYVFEKFEDIKKNYPIDTERVYMTGYSQGGYNATSALFRVPEKITAIAPSGNDIYRTWDNFNTPFTEEETQHLTDVFVPVMQVVGQHEASCFVPVNDWYPRKAWPNEGGPKPYEDPRRNDAIDPTVNHKGPRRFSNQPAPPEGADKHQWMMWRLNMRMKTLGCEERDPATCISYLNAPADDIHRIVGFYADREEIRILYGAKHWIMNIDNKDGINAFRYCVVENHPHQWPISTAELEWEFFRQYRRDTATGRIIVDPI